MQKTYGYERNILKMYQMTQGFNTEPWMFELLNVEILSNLLSTLSPRMENMMKRGKRIHQKRKKTRQKRKPDLILYFL